MSILKALQGGKYKHFAEEIRFKSVLTDDERELVEKNGSIPIRFRSRQPTVSYIEPNDVFPSTEIPSALKQRFTEWSPYSEEGGVCQTFLALDTHSPTSRLCIIKKLRPVSDPKQFRFLRDNFRREAIILEKLGDSSDQIPALYGYFEEGKDFYLVQEYIKGQSLKQLVKQRGVCPEYITRELLISLLNILVFIHDQGVIHRDIKPGNIILRDHDSKPYLIDFGFGKQISHLSGDSSRYIVAYTEGYTAPEQMSSESICASDIFSLGMTAIYILTGLNRRRMTDETTGEFHWHRHAPSVSLEFATVLNKAIMMDVTKRYSSAREMRVALQKISHTQTVRQTIKVSDEEETLIRRRKTKSILNIFALKKA